jgi:riboflavin biosynthesis pyrimidine reductase
MPRKLQLALRDKATLHLTEERTVDLTRMLQELRGEYRIRRVACEGGAELFRSLLELELVDQLNLTIAPYVFGGQGAPTLTGRSFEFLKNGSVHCILREMRVMEEECFLTFRLRYPTKTRSRDGTTGK